MNVGESNNKDFLWNAIGHLGMLSLLVLSCILWLERSTTFDSSLYGYMLLTREVFYTPHDRWLNYLWQWIPLLAIKFGVSLSTFLKIFSVAPILFLYFIYWIIAHVFKNYKAGIYLVLISLVLVRYKFYSAISEIYLGLGFVALMLCLLTSKWFMNEQTSDFKKIGVGILILVFNYLGHPLMFFPMGVVIFLDYLINKDWKSKTHFALMGATILLFIIKYLNGKGSSHEGPVIDSFFQSIGSGSFIETTSNLYSLNVFWQYAGTQWIFPLIIVIGLLIYFVKEKRFAFVIVLSSACIFWVVFVAHLTSYLKEPTYFMIEGYYHLIGPLLFTPLLYFKWDKSKYIQMGILVLLIGYGTYGVYSSRPFYTERISDLRSKLQIGNDLGSRNLIAPAEKQVWDTYWYLWSVPFESLIHSTLINEGKSSLMIIDSYPNKSHFEKPFDVMIGVPTDTLKNMECTYFNFDTRPFIPLK